MRDVLPPRATAALGLLMAVQGILGLAFPSAYRDPEWIRATWWGNDGTTVLLAAPLLWVGRGLAAAGSVRGVLLGLGVLAYAVYNYAFYLLGAALNIFLPLYAVLVVLAAWTLGRALLAVDSRAVADSFRAATPHRVVGGYLVFVAAGLTGAWLSMWAAYVFAGRATPVDPQVFRLVAALDLTLMVPALAAGGVMLWRGTPAGYVVAALSSIQGALYLVVLTVNAGIMIARGLAAAPGELPIWGPLAVLTALAAGLLLARAGPATPGVRR